MAEGKDVLDALIAGVNIVELDPLDTSVGYGGLPNAEGVVQLDASCMHGPKKRAGAVACLEGVRTPSLVAQKVMDYTDHHLIVGQRRAAVRARHGIHDRRRSEHRALAQRPGSNGSAAADPLHYLDPIKRTAALRQVDREMMAEGLIDPNHFYGTINCNGVNAKAEICGVTTTSGLAWKIPGRVGDSPILGAGLYVDGAIGAAGSTGRGEANLFSLCLVPDRRRNAPRQAPEGRRHGSAAPDQGQHDREAAAQRARRAELQHQLLHRQREGGLRGRGDVQPGKIEFAVCDEKGPRLELADPLLPGAPE